MAIACPDKPSAQPLSGFTDLDDDALLNQEEAAWFLRLSPNTLQTWRCTGRYNLPYSCIGRYPRYRMGDLRQFVTRRTRGRRADVSRGTDRGAMTTPINLPAYQNWRSFHVDLVGFLERLNSLLGDERFFGNNAASDSELSSLLHDIGTARLKAMALLDRKEVPAD